MAAQANPEYSIHIIPAKNAKKENVLNGEKIKMTWNFM